VNVNNSIYAVTEKKIKKIYNGLFRKDNKKFSSKMADMLLVLPQPGQKCPVNKLKGQIILNL